MAPLKTVAQWSKLRRWLYLALATAVTVILLSWVLRDASLPLVWQILQQAKLQWIVVAWLAYLAVFWVRAWRWGTLLSARHPPGRFRSRLHAALIGFGASSILPGHAGEFIRSALLYRFDRVPVAASIGTIVVERLLDIGVVFLLLLLPLVWGGQSLPIDRFNLMWIGGIILLVWGLLLISASLPTRIAAQTGRICCWLGLGRFQQRIVHSVHQLLSGLDGLRQPQRTLFALLQTLGSWGLNAITYWASLKALGIESPGIWGAIFTQSATAFAIVLPSSPGYIGPFEAGIHYALGLYNVSAEQSIACALLLRFLMYVTIPIIAVLLMLSLGMTKADLSLQPLQQETSEVNPELDLTLPLPRARFRIKAPK